MTVNVDEPEHEAYRQWWENCTGSEQAFGMADLVLSLRILTHPGIFNPPTPPEMAFRFVQEVPARPNCVEVKPGPRHWDIFVNLCRRANARGNFIPDAYLAALASESGSEWITANRAYSRFPGLRWRHPIMDS